MSHPRAIRYYSFADLSGYGQAAVACVRALVNAGIDVQWLPMTWHNEDVHVTWSDSHARAFLEQCGTSGHLADLPALIERTAAMVDHDVVIVHAPPEYWPRRFAPGKRNVGYCAWETDRPPAHWLPLLRLADRIFVPSTQNRDAFQRGGLRAPVHIVPHVRRHCWCEFTPGDIAAARADLGIPATHTILYTIGSWDPRKAIPDLLRAFATAFSADDPVALLVKTGTLGHAAGPFYEQRRTRDLATQAITQVAQQLGRPVPSIVLHDEAMSGDEIDLIHAVGDIFVSLTRGEGWGLGAFEAATLGKPVIMTGWGGHTDYLGDWDGAIAQRSAPVPLWPPDRPSYFPGQRWAEAEGAAAAAMLRAVVADPRPAQTQARRIAERIVEAYSEQAVVARFLEALA